MSLWVALCSAWWRVTWEVGGASCPRHRAGKEAGAARLSGPAPRSASACTAFSCHPSFGRAVGHLRLVPLCLFSLRAYVGQTLHLGTHRPWCLALPARVSEAHPGGQDDGRSVPLSGNSPPRCLSTAQLPRAAPKPPGVQPSSAEPHAGSWNVRQCRAAGRVSPPAACGSVDLEVRGCM